MDPHEEAAQFPQSPALSNAQIRAPPCPRAATSTMPDNSVKPRTMMPRPSAVGGARAGDILRRQLGSYGCKFKGRRRPST